MGSDEQREDALGQALEALHQVGADQEDADAMDLPESVRTALRVVRKHPPRGFPFA